MRKIRINELARELEVKPGVILDLLPELGVQEKKTHSSSVDEDVAIVLRDRLQGSGSSSSSGSRPSNGHHLPDHDPSSDHDLESDSDDSASSEQDLPEVAARVTRAPFLPPLRSPARESAVEEADTATANAAPASAAHAAPGIPDARSSAPVSTALAPSPVAHSMPATPVITPVTVDPPPAAPQESSPQPDQPGTPAPLTQAEPDRPTQRFQPLRPPLVSGSALQPPLAPGQPSAPPSSPPISSPINRSIPIPARPLPSQPRSASSSGPLPAGPRQPLPPAEPRQTPAAPERAMRPSPGLGQPRPPSPPSGPASPGSPQSRITPPTQVTTQTQATPQSPIRPYQPPTHVVAPGPSQGSPGQAAPGQLPSGPSLQGSPGQAPSAVPGSPIPPRPAPRPSSPGLTPGAPIAPRPQGARPPLAGQPSARPTVLPRPDLVQRLTKQQSLPTARPPAPAPGAPRPGAPSARPSSPAPGQPLYRGPIRPGQPFMRGPGGPGGPGAPTLPGQRRPGMRPMHPTTPLRAEPATPPPTDTRRHQAKPGGLRPGVRKREDREEGIIRERVSKRHAIAEPPPIDREITVAEGVTVKELSEKLAVKANLVIKKLVERKIFATINQTLDVKLAEELAREFGASTNQVSYEEESTQDIELAEEPTDLVRRAPVVTIMGHVDHGKTSLLDAIRETNVAGREAGGITQHIGAYHIEKNGRKIVFIDTPGHQAFTRMRARGAKVTDIVILVVSADDGVMPQTLEAIDHAKAAKVPILVAINKIDKPGAQADRVKQQLSDRGLLAEDWGGDTVMVPVSAKTGQNLDLLLEMILLVADLQDLRATPSRPAIGTVLEAKLDKGRGPVATMLVRNGTFRVGDFFICGALFSKVRAMFDDRGSPVKEAEPSMPVEVIGLESLPEVGDNFQVVSDTSKAKQIVIYREAKNRDAAMAKGARVATLDSLAQKFKEGDLKDLNLIIKADVGGTAEVLSDTLQQLSNDKVRVRVLHAGVGAITETDVLLASASEAVIIGFNVRPERNAQSTADQQKVDIRLHSIIYELIDEIKLAMTGMLDPVFKETVEGHAEVRETFRISKIGTVAGCFVTDGTIRRANQLRVIRGGDVIHTAKIEALKRFKNDASEVKNGLECGISLVNFNNVLAGDILESFTLERVAVESPIQ